MKVLLVDAFDSFAYIIYQYLRCEGAEVRVVRSGELTPDEVVSGPEDAIVLGPGPGHPAASGHVEIVHAVAGRKPLLGVCLGHQAIGLAFGARITPALRLMHGKTSLAMHDGQGMFEGVVDELRVTRYHSLVVSEVGLPSSLLKVSAVADDDGAVMGLRHRELAVEGVQFHPESILTQAGGTMFGNFLRGAEK